MRAYRIEGDGWESDVFVSEGYIISAEDEIEWIIGFEMEHINRYFEQFGFQVTDLRELQ